MAADIVKLGSGQCGIHKASYFNVEAQDLQILQVLYP